LVAAGFHPSVHIRVDDFFPFIVNGLIEPWLPDSAHQNHVLGAAAASAAIQFASGGYTVIFDGHLFPDGVEGMAQMCKARGVPLHYVVLRPDLATCVARAREGAGSVDQERFAELHARFADLGEREAKVIDASPAAEVVAEAVLTAFTSGTLLETGAPA
jgi:hypothetical protein